MSTPSSLVKFMNRRSSPGGHGPLHWGRADLDGAPYRGQFLPPMPEEELENRLVRTANPQIRTFDLADPDDAKAYVDVLDMIANKWATLIYREHLKTTIKRIDRDNHTVTTEIKLKVYVEWAVWEMIDGQPMHSQRPYLGRSND